MGQKPLTPAEGPPAIIEIRRCSGCGRCVAACPQKILTLESANRRKHAVNTSPERCTICGNCIVACPLQIIVRQ